MKKYYSGLAASGKAYFVLEHLPKNGTLVVVVPEEEVTLWQGNVQALSTLTTPVRVFPFLQADHFGRLNTIKNIADDRANAIIIATVGSLGEQTVQPDTFRKEVLVFEPGRDYEFNDLTAALSRLGYQRADFVEERGQFSRRGEILDIWSPDQERPWRLVFAINTLESLRIFDVVTQRSEEFLKKTELLPAKEETQTYLSEYLPGDTLFYFEAPPPECLPIEFSKFDWLVNDPLSPEAIEEDFKSFTRWGGNFPLFGEELRQYADAGCRLVIICGSQGEKERIDDVLFEQKWDGAPPEFLIGPLADGFYSRKRKLAVLSSQEILYRRRPVNFPKFKTGRRLEGLWEISSGDYVVHEKYGIGRYLGLRKLVRGEHESEYLCIEYKNGDKLYVPPDDFRVVQKYVGVEGCRPRLFSLDTASWERAKQRAADGARDMAEELLKLYAERHNAPGHAYQTETPWERELADSFPYQETQDQLRAIEDVKKDLENQAPMERVICGDVGFGKTEVAIRAAFKVAQDSKQVAVLVPTTVLAEQHYNTFSNRLAPFPTRVALISRFQDKKEQKKVVEGLAAGTVDIVVGTHRLLQKDVRFKDLGLLIIDEEHRFGVKQKEKIKAFKKNVDVLLMSATPIPRTLSLALSSLRDLSVIETPPYGRLPIETHLGPYDDKLVKRIIQAELSRGGQVYYVHNRVETIFSRAQHLQDLLPDARFGVIHGQMAAAVIEKTMWNFLHRHIDVLVATSIIESGLDIPSVNTMIIEEAENFGLAQLYQLRGRIGREKQKAYCYLFYTPDQVTEDSRKRLEALKEFGELGAGFRLALRDLEIRGAGNILSAKQHGFVKEIGFELYSRLLDEASQSLKSGKPVVREEFKSTIDFALPSFLPQDYIDQEDLRIIFYRKLATARSERDLEAVREELKDRFGSLPQAVVNLLTLTALRLQAEQEKIKGIAEEDGCIAVYFSNLMSFTPDGITAMAADYGDKMEFMRGEAPGIRFRKDMIPRPPFPFLREFLQRIAVKYTKKNTGKIKAHEPRYPV
jgi:transcription-repair coupling factor (superfamily II helicase)